MRHSESWQTLYGIQQKIVKGKEGEIGKNNNCYRRMTIVRKKRKTEKKQEKRKR
jgi:hypothetical protein